MYLTYGRCVRYEGRGSGDCDSIGVYNVTTTSTCAGLGTDPRVQEALCSPEFLAANAGSIRLDRIRKF